MSFSELSGLADVAWPARHLLWAPGPGARAVGRFQPGPIDPSDLSLEREIAPSPLRGLYSYNFCNFII